MTASAPGTDPAGDRVPRLCDAVAFVETPAGIIIDGGPRRTILRHGSIPPSLAAALSGTFDGRRSYREVSAQLDVDEASIRALADLLDASSSDARAALAAPIRHYYSRTLGPRYAEGMDGHLARLAGSSVLVLGEFAGLSEVIVNDLQQAGLAGVRAGKLPGAQVADWLDCIAAAESRGALAIIDHSAGCGEDPDRAWVLARQILDTGIAVLHVRIGPQRADVGPISMTGGYPCLGCVRRSVAEGALGEPPASTIPAPATGMLAAARTVADTLRLLGTLGPEPVRSTVARIFADESPSQCLMLTSYPSCEECAGTSTDPESWADTRAGALETILEKPSARFRRSMVPTRREQANRTEQATHRESFSARPVLRLPCDTPTATAPEDEPSIGSDQARLARILMLGCGRRSRDTDLPHSRWVPLAGNFGSVTTYVVTVGNPFNLTGRVFRYHDIAHAVESVAAEPRVEDGSTASLLLSQRDDGSVGIVLTSTIARLGTAYDHAAIQLAHLDSGCVLSQLLVLADGADLELQQLTAWDESVYDLIGARPSTETVTAIVSLRDRSTGCP